MKPDFGWTIRTWTSERNLKVCWASLTICLPNFPKFHQKIENRALTDFNLVNYRPSLNQVNRSFWLSFLRILTWRIVLWQSQSSQLLCTRVKFKFKSYNYYIVEMLVSSERGGNHDYERVENTEESDSEESLESDNHSISKCHTNLFDDKVLLRNQNPLVINRVLQASVIRPPFPVQTRQI